MHWWRGDWIVEGDFNSILNRKERLVVKNSYRNMDMSIFCDFIEGIDLVDVPVVGDLFTWLGGSGKAMSRIDHFLISEGVISIWKILGQHVRKRDISDHCPIWIKEGLGDWGPKPFKFNNCRVNHKDFLRFMKYE